MRVQTLRRKFENLKGQQAAIKAQIKAEKSRLTALLGEHEATTQAHLILQEAAKMTQENLQYRISTLVSLAMEGVFNEPYTVHLTFEPQRGKTIANISFRTAEDNELTYEAAGGGVADVASLGLLFSLWTMQVPKTRNLLILDEPLKWLKGGNLPEKGAAMLSQISHRLGVQILMVSHSPELIEHADRVFQVTKKRGISTVKILK